MFYTVGFYVLLVLLITAVYLLYDKLNDNKREFEGKIHGIRSFLTDSAELIREKECSNYTSFEFDRSISGILGVDKDVFITTLDYYCKAFFTLDDFPETTQNILKKEFEGLEIELQEKYDQKHKELTNNYMNKVRYNIEAAIDNILKDEQISYITAKKLHDVIHVVDYEDLEGMAEVTHSKEPCSVIERVTSYTPTLGYNREAAARGLTTLGRFE